MIRPHHYVKWINRGELRYGIAVPRLLGEARRLGHQGIVLIDDGILPHDWEVEEQQVTDVGPAEYQEYVRKCYGEARRVSDELGNKIAPGKLISRYDDRHHAAIYYIVTEADKLLCRVDWRGYSGDRLIYHPWGWTRTLAVSSCVRLLQEDVVIRWITEPA